MMTIYLNRKGLSSLDIFIQYSIQPDFLDEPILKEALQDIEKVHKAEGLALYTDEQRVKSPQSLSRGMKALILCYYYAKGDFDRLITNCCMDNTTGPYLRELSKKYDFSISWDYYLYMGWDEEIEAMDFDTGTIFHTAGEVTNFYAGKAGVYDLE